MIFISLFEVIPARKNFLYKECLTSDSFKERETSGNIIFTTNVQSMNIR